LKSILEAHGMASLRYHEKRPGSRIAIFVNSIKLISFRLALLEINDLPKKITSNLPNGRN